MTAFRRRAQLAGARGDRPVTARSPGAAIRDGAGRDEQAGRAAVRALDQLAPRRPAGAAGDLRPPSAGRGGPRRGRAQLEQARPRPPPRRSPGTPPSWSRRGPRRRRPGHHRGEPRPPPPARRAARPSRRRLTANARRARGSPSGRGRHRARAERDAPWPRRQPARMLPVPASRTAAARRELAALPRSWPPRTIPSPAARAARPHQAALDRERAEQHRLAGLLHILASARGPRRGGQHRSGRAPGAKRRAAGSGTSAASAVSAYATARAPPRTHRLRTARSAMRGHLMTLATGQPTHARPSARQLLPLSTVALARAAPPPTSWRALGVRASGRARAARGSTGAIWTSRASLTAAVRAVSAVASAHALGWVVFEGGGGKKRK